MQRPSVGDLLNGLRKSLTDTVLPALPKGPAHAQMKAALHLIGRLERSWDLAQTHLTSDNADIEAVIGALAFSVTSPVPSIEPTGYNDPHLRTAAAQNLLLHERLASLDPTPEIEALYRRMATRDSIFVGDARPEGAAPHD